MAATLGTKGESLNTLLIIASTQLVYFGSA
jgi:hypothetical protein